MQTNKQSYVRITVLVFIGAVLISLYIMLTGRGSLADEYGPGAYYYTDIPGWQEIFYPELYEGDED